MRIGIAAVFVALAALIVGSALASTGSSETLVLTRDPNLAEIGWTATGAFNDSGSWTTDFSAFSRGPVFAGTTKTTETNAAQTGSFRILFQIEGLPNTFQGNWKIVDGTGVYANLHGAGTWSEADDTATGNHVFTLTGRVHFDP
jgi:hypothetical protein